MQSSIVMDTLNQLKLATINFCELMGLKVDEEGNVLNSTHEYVTSSFTQDVLFESDISHWYGNNYFVVDRPKSYACERIYISKVSF